MEAILPNVGAVAAYRQIECCEPNENIMFRVGFVYELDYLI
jgi:hypothetical protein